MGSSLVAPTAFATPEGGRIDLLIVAGEHSGDQQAARMLRNARAENPELKVAALGGPDLRSAGAQLLFDLTASSVVGLAEVLRNYGFFKQVFASTVAWIKLHRPRAVCLVDYPGFNLRLAKALFEAGISCKGGGEVTVLYYISPQIWAWKAGRRFAMARRLDALAVIFPFEVACYADTDLPVSFVGHPFLADDYRNPVAYDPHGPVLLLPGSRRAAVSRIAPVLLEAYALYRSGGGVREAVVITPGPEIEGRILALLTARPALREGVRVVSGPERVNGGAVLTSSGTMSLACALAGIPGAIAYRANFITYLIARRVIRVPYLGIANLILDAPIYREFLQGAARPADLAQEIRSALEDASPREATAAGAVELRRCLHDPDTGGAGQWLLSRLSSR